MTAGRLSRDRCALVVVDLQEAFRPVIDGFDAVVEAVGRVIDGARILGVRVLVTEHYPSGLGPTVGELARRLDGVEPLEKVALSATEADGFDLGGRDQVLLCGIEAHICIHQTALALLERGVETHAIEDAISSRTRQNRELGLGRMAQDGVRRSGVEMALFELVARAGGDDFRAVQRLVR
jgi:nicotinamidase-related amidase